MSREIITGLHEGMPEATEAFVREYGPRIHAFVLDVVGNREDAEELTSDVMLKAIRAIGHYDPAKASVATWLLRIARNEVISRLRRAKMVTDSLEGLREVADEEPADDPRIEILHQAVRLLQPAERALLHMHYYDNMAMSEIAYAMDMTENAVTVRLYRIRAKLKKIIEHTYGS